MQTSEANPKLLRDASYECHSIISLSYKRVNMSLAMSGSEITLHEKMLVPGDFVPYEVLYVTDVWQGAPVKKQPPPIPLQIETGAKQFGADPHRETVDKISAALGSLMERKMGAAIPTKDLINVRSWR